MFRSREIIRKCENLDSRRDAFIKSKPNGFGCLILISLNYFESIVCTQSRTLLLKIWEQVYKLIIIILVQNGRNGHLQPRKLATGILFLY